VKIYKEELDMKKSLLLLILFLGVTLAFSRGFRVAIVDYNEVLTSYSETKKINDKLMQEKQERQQKLDKLQNELKKMEGQYMTDEKKLSEKEKQKRKEEFQKKLMVLRQKMQTYTEELKVLQRKSFQRLNDKIKSAINKVAKGYDLVIDKQAVFKGGKDITDKVIDYLNKQALNK
jgi:Skp family chaperone for outer membrane proteins